MKFFTNKEITKKIIIAVLLVMTFNFIAPVTSKANNTPRGGKLFEPLFQFTCFVGDLLIKGMQWMFMGYSDINENIDIDTATADTKFNILYSPGVIFSNKAPALDINFFNPKEDLTLSVEGDPDIEKLKEINDIPTFIDDNPGIESVLKNYIPEKASEYGYEYDKIRKLSSENKLWYEAVAALGMDALTDVSFYIWEDGGKKYGIKIDLTQYTSGYMQSTINYKYNGTVYELIDNTKTGDTRESSAKTLQKTVSTWYKALRAFALVGLLSVLVYIGIRILISSTGQEKSKYKKMIMDWVTAICILFVLQYMMIFTLKITEKITDVLSVQVLGENGRDNLMSDIRGRVGGNDETEIDYTSFETFVNTIIYIALVIETGIFTVHYLKRLVYMAFFTMIAPLVALTYPVDKIKDGQAQAFSTLIKEYIFNALIQPVHLLLYYIFISSASSMVDVNPLYAVVALGFMMPAEKFFRKMFGFEKASSVSQVGAAAGGALVMNAINKMGHKSGKQAAGKAGGTSNSGGSSGGSTQRYISGPGRVGSSGGAGGSGNTGGQREAPSGGQSGGSGSTVFGQSINPAQARGRASIKNGAKTLGGHYFNRGNGIKALKGAGRMVRKGAVGALGAATLGTIGLAAGVATGDLGNAFKYGAGGAMAGYMGANYVGDKVTEFGSKNAEILKEGALGTAEYNTRNSVKELTRDNDFNRVCKDLGVTDQKGREALIRQFHSNGITNSEDIKKAMNVRASNAGTSQAEIIAAQKIRQEATKYGMKKKDIEQKLMGQLGTNNPNDPTLKRAMNLIDQL